MNLRKHYVPFFGEMTLSDIDTETAQAFINQMIAAHYAHPTLRNLKRGLSAVFEEAVKYRYIKSNPVPAVDLPPEGQRERLGDVSD